MRSSVAGTCSEREGPRLGERSRACSSATASRRTPVTDSAISMYPPLGGEGAATAAAASRVGILECEARAHHRRDVIDGDAIQVLRRERINENAPPFLIHDQVVFRGFVFDEQTVLEAAATAGLNTHTK